MELIIQTAKKVYIIPDVEEFDIRTDAGLTLDPIPKEEETYGFRVKENADVEV